MLLAFLLVVALCGGSTVAQLCPTWMHWASQRQMCDCDSVWFTSVVLCDSHHMELAIEHGYCMTFKKTDNRSLIVGTCPYNQLSYIPQTSFFYQDLPLNRSLLESAMCGDFNRRGQLCGDCIDNYSVPVYTYHPQCVKCPRGTNNWGKYIAVSLVPQTLFSLTILVLGLRATSPRLNGFILYSQLVTPPPVLRLFATLMYNFRFDPWLGHDEALSKFMAAVFSFHSMWNMDFLRINYEPFCLHPNVSTLQILALDYIIAAYPLIVIIIIYLLVKLYYHNCTLIVWMWKPFQTFSSYFNKNCSIQTSLVDAFATFLLLSYIKFLSVSFTLLFPALTFNAENEAHYPIYLYYASTTEYMGREHFPYALLAIVSIVVFTISPILLLCLYPCRWFQHCLNRYNLSFQALHIFMDTFQGSYKNGMNGTRDYRYFAAGNFILMAGVFLSLICQMLFLKYWITFLIVAVFLAAFSICKPFQKPQDNNLHIMWLTLVLLFYVVTINYTLQPMNVDKSLACWFALVFVFTPPLCITYVGVRIIYYCCKYWCGIVYKRCLQQDPELGPLLTETTGTYNSIT